jgi:hypothetical protein
MTSEERSVLNATRNAEQKQQRADASKALESKSVNLQEVAKQGGSLGRRIEREVRRFEATGRVSNWLAGQTAKAEASQNAAQQSGFSPPRSQPPSNTNVPLTSIPLSPSDYFSPRPFNLKPDITPPTPITGTGQRGTCIGLNLYIKPVGELVEVWIGAGTVAGDLPSDFDPAEGKSMAGSGSGNVWAEVNINGTTGDIVSVAVEGGGTTPNDTDTSFYYTLGNYSYTDGVPTITNYGCGSLDVTVCRNWFASEAPIYGVTINR